MTKEDSRKAAIAARLRAAREMAGLSQGQVAKMLGLHRPSISEAEAGRRKVSAEELTTFANIYKVSLSWLACADPGDTPDPEMARYELAARKLSKMKKEDFDHLMKLLAAYRTETEEGSNS
jgi:transcriptional regulator with XRE-family HTH domain